MAANIIAELKHLKKNQLEEKYEADIKEIDDSFIDFLTKSQPFLKETKQGCLYFNLSKWFNIYDNEILKKYIINLLESKYKIKLRHIKTIDGYGDVDYVQVPFANFYEDDGGTYNDDSSWKRINKDFVDPPIVDSNDVQVYTNESLNKKLYLINDLIGYDEYCRVVKEYQQYLEDLKIAEEESKSRTWYEFFFGPSIKFPEFKSMLRTYHMNLCNTYIYEVTW